MYLCDRDICEIIDDINFNCRFEEHPFDSDLQIGPASVDLRIDTVFWRIKPAKKWWSRWIVASRDVIDLRSHDIYEALPRLHWVKVELNPGETFVLKPGESIMARTYEEFTMPSGHAGKMAARVSYARLGLQVHCGADFINPGWRGRHPLQLVNLSGLPIRIAPLFPVAQLSFVRLSSRSQREYSEADRYMYDDGGPSKWWQDAIVKKLVSRYGQDSMPHPVSLKVNSVIADGEFSDEQLERLLKFREKRRASSFESGDDFIRAFAESEKKKYQNWSVLTKGILALEGIFFAASLGELLIYSLSWRSYSLFAATLLFFVPSVRAARSVADGRKPYLPDNYESYLKRRVS